MKKLSISLIVIGMVLLFLGGWDSSRRWYAHKRMNARIDTIPGMDLGLFFPSNVNTGGARGLDFGTGWHNDSLTVKFYLEDGYIWWTNYAGQTVRLEGYKGNWVESMKREGGGSPFSGEIVIDPPYDTTKSGVFSSRAKISIDSSKPKK